MIFCCRTCFILASSVFFYHTQSFSLSTWYFSWRTWFFGWRRLKTLPEAQRTQGIDSITWIILSANSKLISVVLLELVISLATRWQHLITYWLIHWWYLHQIQTWSLGGIIFINWTTTCIRSKFGHQIAAICISLKYTFYDLFLAVYDQITNIMRQTASFRVRGLARLCCDDLGKHLGTRSAVQIEFF